MSSAPLLRIGTRGSPLALAQANDVKRRLSVAHPDLASPSAIEIVVISTSGDAAPGPLADIGGKGLFTKEIEEALAGGGIDLAVHSMKDMPTVLPVGLEIAAMTEREDTRDVLIFDRGRLDGLGGIADLPRGAVVGTAALRRQAQLLHRRPDLTVTNFRGNVGTRLRKLSEGVVDVTLLARAGLNRLGLTEVTGTLLTVEEMLPAVAQGAVGIEIRSADDATRARLAALDDAVTHTCVRAERAMLAVLDGSCRTPIAGLATIDPDGVLTLEGLVARPNGSELHRFRMTGAVDDAERIGREVGHVLRDRTGPGFFRHQT